MNTAPERPDYFNTEPPRRLPQGAALPALRHGEVEIARLTLERSGEAEVTSLRARPSPDGSIFLVLVDEFGTLFNLPVDRVTQPLTALELLGLLQQTNPPPMGSPGTVRVDSDFYLGLNELAAEA